MSPESESYLKLSVWREYTPIFPLASCPLGSDVRVNAPVGGDNSILSKAIYSITLREDVLAGIENPDIRRGLQELLRGLKVSDPPSSRHISKLDKFISRADQALKSNESFLSLIANQPDSNDENPDEFNALLALKLHLQWLLRCFSDHPKITVDAQ